MREEKREERRGEVKEGRKEEVVKEEKREERRGGDGFKV